MASVPEIAPSTSQHVTLIAFDSFHRNPSRGRQAAGRTREAQQRSGEVGIAENAVQAVVEEGLREIEMYVRVVDWSQWLISQYATRRI